MRVTVCGSSCSIPRPGRACSGYLVEADGTALVIDLGSGAFANVVKRCAADALDGIVITHMHADHFLDVVPLRYALKYGRRSNGRRIVLHLPPGGEELLRRLVAAFPRENDSDFLDEVYDVRSYDPQGVLRIGSAALTFAPTAHYVPTFAVRCEVGAASIVYSGDTAPSPSVIRIARKAAAFFCEATLSREEETELPRGHCSAREAADMATHAGAKRLILTHYPATRAPAEIAAQARPHFAGPIDIADDGYTLTL
ncbi:MAG: MBL fold metallo-hydrolase [Candidatus Eremiobacteraeota bacterium]|nr:MBL fold metallo-hydrolase [Candidatus Eremiobacteraeota bacterium]